MRRFHGSTVGALAQPVYVCKSCGAWQVDIRGRPIGKPEFFCLDGPNCNGTEFHRFPSKAEARAFGVLALRRTMGEIADIELQVPYRLHVISPNGEKIQIGKYLADFRYREVMTGKVRVLDIKGNADTHMSAWKRKHVEAEYGLEITIYQP